MCGCDRLLRLALLWFVFAAGLAGPAATGFCQSPGAGAATATTAAEPRELTPVQKWTKLAGWATAVAVSADGRQLAIGQKNEVLLRSLGTGPGATATAPPHPAGTDASAATSGTAGATSAAVLATKSGPCRALAYSPDGRRLAVGGYQRVQLWQLSPPQIEQEWKGPRGLVTGLAWSPDGQRLLIGADDETARVMVVADGREERLLKHDFPVTGVAWSPEGTQLATAAGDESRPTKPGVVTVWDAGTGALVRTLTHHERPVLCVAFSPDGQWLVSGSLDERAIVFDRRADKVHGFYAGHQRPVQALLFLDGGATVASVGGGRNVGGNLLKIWTVAEGTELAQAEVHEARPVAVAATPDRRRLVTGGYDNAVFAFDVQPLGLPSATIAPEVGKDPAEPPVSALAPTNQAATRLQTPLLRRVAIRPAAPSERPSVRAAPALPAMTPHAVALQPAANPPAEKSKDAAQNPEASAPAANQPLRIGVIGLDTSHAPAFAKLMNDPKAPEDLAGVQVVAAFPPGSPDIVSSTSRVAGYTEQFRQMGIAIVDSIPDLLERVDAVLLETNDGRPHLEQVLPVLKARKPCFIDKPIAGSLEDAVAIFELARHYRTPVFSASSLRYVPGALDARAQKWGDILGADCYSPASLEKTHPDLFWYGIHGVELLFTTMGTGCQQVTRTHTDGCDVCVGVWTNGRVGTFRGIRAGKAGYGGKAFSSTGIHDLGTYAGYRPLAVAIVNFFKTRQVPVSEAETLEIYTFMEAADESRRRGGVPVSLPETLAKAQAAAQARLPGLLAR